MARFLAYTSPARGHLFPITPVLLELRSRGHEVTVRTLASEVGLMRGLGFEAGAIDPQVERVRMDDFTAGSPLGAQKRAVRVFSRRAHHDAADLVDATERARPDALIVDINSWGALAAAEASGRPWASWCPYPLPLRSRDAPPFGPGLRPARGPLGRARDRVLAPVVSGSLVRTILPPVNEVRSRFGLPDLQGAADLFTGIPLLLYMTAEPFEYPRSDWPPNVRLVGPCDWDPPAQAPEWLAGIDRPIVLVTTSSEFQDDARLVRAALEGLAGEDLFVVATLPSADPGEFAAPPNAKVLPFVPHALLLDRAACAVTHGGMGATQKALARGIPVCVVPFGRDQLEVARRVEVAGAGSRLPARRLSPGRLRSAVREALACADGAGRIAAAYRATGGPARAAAELEGLVGAPAAG